MAAITDGATPQYSMTTPPAKPEPRLPPYVLYAMLIIFLLVGSICLAVWMYFRYARPIGSGSAGSFIMPQSFASPWTTRPVVLLGLGDNATQGRGASPAHGYFQRLITNPPDEFSDMQGICLSKVIPQLQQVNLAVADATSIDCLEQQLSQLKAYPADTFGIVVITVGINDILHDFGRSPPRDGALYGANLSEIGGLVSGFEKRLRLITRRARETFPGRCRIYIANLCDPTDRDGDIELAGLPAWAHWLYAITSFNRAISLHAKHNPDVTIVDIHSAFIGHGTHCTHFWHDNYRKQDPHYWFASDVATPNERGHDAIRRQFLIELSRELPELLQIGNHRRPSL